MHVDKILTPKELQDTTVTIIIVPDVLYNQMIVDPENQYGQSTINGFIVKNWDQTKRLLKKSWLPYKKGIKI